MKFTMDTFIYNNGLRHISPLWRSGFAGGLLLLSLLSHPIVQVAIFVWMILWTLWYGRIPWKPYLLLLGGSLVFYIISLPALLFEVEHTLQFEGESLLSFHLLQWTFYVTGEGVTLAYSLFFRSIASLSCLFFILFTLPFLEVLQVMKKLRLPQIMVELSLIMYRFIFLVVDTAYGVLIAQKARGGHASFSEKLRDLGILFGNLFTHIMERNKGITHGLLSRGLTEEILLPPMECKGIPRRYQIEIVLGCCLLLFLEGWVRVG